jgi:class 3 adenylate cyclase/DNA-binding beta-propeller fold protein YncE
MGVDPTSDRASPTPSPNGQRAAESRTFLIADIRGYTRYTDQHGDEAAAALAAQFANLVRAVVGEHNGVLVEVRGDETLNAFVSARQALHAAVEIQARIRGEGLPRGVGIGIDSGEAVPVDSGFRGTALNVAARLCARAGPGEILASDTTVRLAGHVDGMHYASARTYRLKGLEQPLRAVRVEADTTQTAQNARGGRSRVGTVIASQPLLTASGLVVVVGLVSLAVLLSTQASPGGAQPSLTPRAVIAASPSPAILFADVLGFRAGNGRTGAMPGPGPRESPGPIGIRWQFGAEAAMGAPPAIAHQQVYVGDGAGRLHVLEASTGRELWTYDVGSPIATTPTFDGSQVYVATEAGALNAVDVTTHKRTWSLMQVSPTALAVDGMVAYVGRKAETLAAVSAASGDVLWETKLGGTPRYIALDRSTALATVAETRDLYAVDRSTGRIRWQKSLPSPPVGAPAVSGSSVFLAVHGKSGSDQVISIRAASGEEDWTWTAPQAGALGTLIVTDRYVYATAALSEGAVVWAIDPNTGDLAFPRFLQARVLSASAVGETVFVTLADATVRALDARDQDGIELWKVSVGTAIGEPVVTGETVFVVARSGKTDRPKLLAVAVVRPGSQAGPDPWEHVTDLVASDQQRAQYLNVALDAKGNVYAADRIVHRIVIWDRAGKPQLWGRFGSRPGEFNFGGVTAGDQSQSVAIASDGRIAVGDGGNHRVQIFDANRKFIRAIGREGRAPGQFVNPCCVAFDPQGRLYVADAGRNDIQVFDTNGLFVRIIGGPGSGEAQFDRLGVPYIDPDTGLIWIPDFSNDRVEVVDADGHFVTEYRANDHGRSFTGVNGVVLDRAGRLFVVDDGDNNFVWVLDSEGSVLARMGPRLPDGSTISPTYLALTANGRLYLPDAEGSRVVVMQLLPPLWPPP